MKSILDHQAHDAGTSNRASSSIEEVRLFIGMWLSYWHGLLNVVQTEDPKSLNVFRGETSIGNISVTYKKVGDPESQDFILAVGKQRWTLNWFWVAGRQAFWRNEGAQSGDVWDARPAEATCEGLKKIHEFNLEPGVDHQLRPLQSPLTSSSKTVALCTATKNRLWQLRNTLPVNMIQLWPHRQWTKYYLADFGSTDGTLQFVMNTCQPFIDAGLLEVFSAEGFAEGMPYWHASICKNAVHMKATQEIVVNVDGDNLVGLGFPIDVVQHFEEGCGVLQYEWGGGTCGRIACSHADFLYVRGYDEDAYPMGGQDTDLVHRLQMLGRKYKQEKSPVFTQFISNTQQEKVSNCDPKYGKLKWGQMDKFNCELFRLRRERGYIVRNGKRPADDPMGMKLRRMH